MTVDGLAWAGGLLYTISIFICVLFVFFIIISDALYQVKQKRSDKKFFDAVEEARSDFD